MCEVNEESIVCDSDLSDLEELVIKKCVPTQTQIRQQLGSRLSDVFFENLCSEAKTWLGITPPLVGPDSVWVHPDARLENKVIEKPVPEPVVTHLKALTHGSVLEVGEKCISLLENKHRMEMEAALEKQAEELEDEWRRKLGDTGSAGVDGSGQCKKVVATLMEHFDKCFKEVEETARQTMRKECQLRVEEERAEIAAYMLTQAQEEVDRRDYELCNDFHEILRNELSVLASRFVKQINQEREIAIQILRDTVEKYEKRLNDLKIEMELISVVDVCRAITSERVECNDRIRRLQSEARESRQILLKFIEELKDENCTLKKMSTERLKRLMLWRKKVQVLLKEFQRFINFALKAVPGQSEFLLSIEKLMFKNFPEDSFIQPEDYLHFKNCLKDKIPPCKEDPEPIVEYGSESAYADENAENGETNETPSYEEIYCPSSQYQRNKAECDLNFDYDEYKAMLVSRFASDLVKPKKRKHRKMVCLWKKKSKGVMMDKSNEWYQMLSLVGETDVEHMVPAESFLKKRLKTVLDICNDDPEFAKIILGCSHN